MPHRTRPMTALLVFTGLNVALVSTITPVYDFVCFLPYWERRVCSFLSFSICNWIIFVPCKKLVFYYCFFSVFWTTMKQFWFEWWYLYHPSCQCYSCIMPCLIIISLNYKNEKKIINIENSIKCKNANKMYFIDRIWPYFLVCDMTIFICIWFTHQSMQ